MDNTTNQKEIFIPLQIEDEEFIPSYATECAAGADIKAYLKDPITLLPGHSAAIPTGIRLALPEGFEIQVRPRSGLALNFQVTVLNTPGTIDADYRGEIRVILINHGKEPFTITPGMRIAQLVVAPCFRANFTLANELTASTRGCGGFGHTGYQ